MTPRISILCPTRGRPDNVRRLVESADATASGPVQFVFYVDHDDTCGPPERPPGVSDKIQAHVTQGPRIVLSEMWNECAQCAAADVMMHCGDDIVFRTPGWDDRVLEAFEAIPDRIALVHGDDKFNYGVATHGFLHRAWVDAVGYFCPPYFASDYNDTWLTEVADGLGRRVEVDVLTEHMHPCAGKAEWDVTHRERLARHKQEDCDRIWRDTAGLRAADVEKLRRVIDGRVLVPLRDCPKWSILVATLNRRAPQLRNLLAGLLPQVEAVEGAVEIVLFPNDGERPLGHVRQDLLEAARGEYVSFVDDDDEVSPRFVEAILPLLDGVDYVGWRMQCWVDGRKLLPTFHSLRYERWFDDRRGYYRDISHLNPIRRELALLGDYRVATAAEDVSWASQVRGTGRVRSEHFVDDVMYLYRYDTRDSTQRGVAPRVRRPVRHRGRARRPDLVAAAPVSSGGRLVVAHPYVRSVETVTESAEVGA